MPVNRWDSPQKSLKDKIFDYIIKLNQAALQLRINHWQTESYAEHKATDKFIGEIYSFIYSLAESTMGEMGRPKFNTTHLSVSDLSITSTKWVLESIKNDTFEILAELKVTDYEGLLSLTADFDLKLKKVIYLITLG